MMSVNLYNRFCEIFFWEDTRLENKIIEKENYIIKYQPTDPEPYIELIKARAIKEYFDKYIFTLLKWLDHFVE